jgi:predicted nucleotidyltransferase
MVFTPEPPYPRPLMPPSIKPSAPRTRPARAAKRTDPLSTVLASGALARLFIDLAVRPDESSHGREIQRRTGLTPRSLQAELVRLESLGVVSRRSEGRLVKYALNEGSPGLRALRGLVRELGDPVEVVRDALVDVPGIGAGFVFGSFARGDFRPDSDVDVFLLDEGIDNDRLARRTIEATVLLTREVNVVQFTADELARVIARRGGFIRDVLRSPKIWIAGSEAVFEEVVAGAGRRGDERPV